MTKKVLIAGESWMSFTTHVKGFDTFNTSIYEEGVSWLKKALENGGYEVDFLPNHVAAEKFPYKMEDIKKYACVILSDIGSNTLLLPNQVFSGSISSPNRCDLIKAYVEDGGAFLMIGGYMSFSGVDAKSRYGQTAIADILPVKILDIDDRVEQPQGIKPVVISKYQALEGLPEDWPEFLGYNRTAAIPEGEIALEINGDPFIAFREYGKGRTAVFTSDCAPHWGPPGFVNWEHYDRVWQNIMDWLTK